VEDRKEAWRTYEEVATYLLNQIAEKFGIERVESKQVIKGQKSGTEWEVDAKGIGSRNDILLIIECRRYTSSKQSQEKLGSLAYRIYDTGASGGIIVSPFGLQEGAEKIAKAENIHNVTLSPDSTTTNYILKFLNEVYAGVGEKAVGRASISVTKIDKDGNVYETMTHDEA
jgi:hypothetical protein